jgi:CHAT domain-containing protein
MIASLDAGRETAVTVLRYKGIVLESLLEDRWIAEGHGKSQVGELYQTLQTQKRRLRQQILAGKESPKLKTEVRKLEKELARSTSHIGLARSSLSLKLEDIQGVLTPTSALIEYFVHSRYQNRRWERGYSACIIRNTGEPDVIWCGTSKDIETLIKDYRTGVDKSVESLLKESSRSLYDKLIAPLLPKLGGVETLIISPDAQLNFVSFATWLNPDGRFLIEDFEIRNVAGGRDLLRKSPPPGFESRPAVLIGGPDFRENHQITDPNVIVETNYRSSGGDDFKTISLAPLPGSRKEVGLIAALMKSSQSLVGSEATESALRAIRAPKVLHLATHGFFLNRIEIPHQKPGSLGIVNGEAHLSGHSFRSGGPIFNPMYRSGIALAGAQTTIERWRNGSVGDAENDGILMAAEVADLDLRGTDLVTLSACSSGAGEVLSGEGVLGLRRGFVIAGARNLLMTLWPVVDEDTARFMEEFYREYNDTSNAPGALTKVQRDWLVKKRRERGLVHAVSRAGPFIMSTQGAIK